MVYMINHFFALSEIFFKKLWAVMKIASILYQEINLNLLYSNYCLFKYAHSHHCDLKLDDAH